MISGIIMFFMLLIVAGAAALFMALLLTAAENGGIMKLMEIEKKPVNEIYISDKRMLAWEEITKRLREMPMGIEHDQVFAEMLELADKDDMR